MKRADHTTVLDLLSFIDTDRQLHEIEAVVSSDPASRAHASSASRKEAAIAASVRSGVARMMRGNLSANEQAARLDAYARLLVDGYLDCGFSKTPATGSRRDARQPATGTPR